MQVLQVPEKPLPLFSFAIGLWELCRSVDTLPGEWQSCFAFDMNAAMHAWLVTSGQNSVSACPLRRYGRCSGMLLKPRAHVMRSWMTMRIWVQVEAVGAGSFMGEVLQQELDNSQVPAHVRHSLQLVLGTDASMARCTWGTRVDIPRLLIPPPSEAAEVDPADNPPRKRQRPIPRANVLSQQLRNHSAAISFISKQLTAW